MDHAPTSLCTLAVLAAGPAGCQPLNFEKEATLEPAVPFLEYTFAAPGRDEGFRQGDRGPARERLGVLEEDKEPSNPSIS